MGQQGKAGAGLGALASLQALSYPWAWCGPGLGRGRGGSVCEQGSPAVLVEALSGGQRWPLVSGVVAFHFSHPQGSSPHQTMTFLKKVFFNCEIFVF